MQMSTSLLQKKFDSFDIKKIGLLDTLRIYTKKFCITSNNNKIDSVEIGRIVITHYCVPEVIKKTALTSRFFSY